jgi:hypothetical protein
MAGKGHSPLVGYNTNIRHKAKLYHIQTEDSGAGRPYVTTHLFVDGGRIIATTKTDYSQFLEEKNIEETIRNLMMKQHKAMAIALRDGAYDEREANSDRPQPETKRDPVEKALDIDALERAARARITEKGLDIDAFERGAQAHIAESAVGRRMRGKASRSAMKPNVEGSKEGRSSIKPNVEGSKERRSSTKPAVGSGAYHFSITPRKKSGAKKRDTGSTQSIFGGNKSNEKSLDEVILSYLSEDSEEKES